MPRSARVAGLATLLLILGLLSVRFAPAHTHVGGAWPVGLASGLLIHAGRRRRLAMLVVVLLVAAASYLAGGFPLSGVPAAAVAITAEALVTALVLAGSRRRRLRLWDDLDLVQLVLAAVLGAATGAALFAAYAAFAGQGRPGEVAASVFTAHLVSELILVSFFMEHSTYPGDSGPIERTLRWTLTLVVALAAFLPAQLPFLVFLVIPIVGWGALRAPMREALWQLVAVATVANTSSTFGFGPFDRISVLSHSDSEVAAVPGQVFLLGCALVCIPFAMAVARQQHGAWQVAKERTRLERIVESATGVAIIESDAAGRITLFNPGAESLLGYTQSEVLGRYPDLFHSQEEIERQARHFGVPADLRSVSMALAEPGVGRRDWVYVHRDGSTRDVSVSLVRIVDQGTLIGFLCTAEDISERVRTQVALEAALDTERRAVSRLTEIDRSKDAFVSSVSHELRTPITSIVGYLELLVDGAYGAAPPAHLEALGRIEANSHRLLELIDDLLTLSSVESLDLELTRRPVDLREVVRRVGDRVAWEASERAQHLEVEVPHEPVIVLGDEGHLERMVSNLAVNAIKFTPEGGVVTLRVVHRDEIGVIEVQDTGVGITAEERPLLFNRFYRSSYAQTEAIKGSGLGLSIARSIAHLHGARIGATSEPGRGSTFSVSFEGASHSPAQDPVRG